MAAASKRSTDTVFGLPQGVFGPLSSPARRDYAQVLLHLSRGHLSSNMLDGLDLRRADMQGFLSNALAALSASDFAVDAHNTHITGDAHLVYRNLVDAGWFMERTVGAQTLVVMSRPVLELLHALDRIERGSSVNFTGSLQSIEVAMRTIGEDPLGRAMMLAVAAQQAEEFSARMMAVGADIRANESHIVSQSGFGDMMAAFFDDFVAHLISDYKAMKSRYNPLRHAASIMSVSNMYADDDEIVGRLADGYVACGYADDRDGGIERVRAHLETIAGTFARAQNTVDDIDAVRQRVEERVARAVRYVDAAAAAETQDIQDVMAMLGRLGVDPDALPALPVPGIMLDDYPIGPNSLASPRTRATPVSSVGVEVAVHDEGLAELARARARYAEAMIPTAQSIEAYVESHLRTAASLPLSEFTVESPREMLLLAAVRSVTTNQERSIRERYGVEFRDGHVDGEWSEYAEGLVYRIGSVDDPAMRTPTEAVDDRVMEEVA